jgi:hypothetical protein
MARAIIYPFAADSAERDSLPDSRTQPGYVAYNTGYTLDYQLQLNVEPDAKAIERKLFNGLMYDATQNIQQWQQQMFPDWFAPQGTNPGQWPPYVKYANVRFNGLMYVSSVDNNSSQPGTDSNWELLETPAATRARIPMPYSGNISTPTDFNTIFVPSTYTIPSDAIAAGSPNSPYTLAGMIEIRGDGNFVEQRYSSRDGKLFIRGRQDATSWTAWKEVAGLNQVARVDLSDVAVASNWDTLVSPGYAKVLPNQIGNNAPPIVPVSSNAMLNVIDTLSPNVTVQVVYNCDTTQAILWRAFNGTSWTAWQTTSSADKVAKAGDTMTGALVNNYAGVGPVFSSAVDRGTAQSSWADNTQAKPLLQQTANPAGNSQIIHRVVDGSGNAILALGYSAGSGGSAPGYWASFVAGQGSQWLLGVSATGDAFQRIYNSNRSVNSNWTSDGNLTGSKYSWCTDLGTLSTRMNTSGIVAPATGSATDLNTYTTDGNWTLNYGSLTNAPSDLPGPGFINISVVSFGGPNSFTSGGYVRQTIWKPDPNTVAGSPQEAMWVRMGKFAANVWTFGTWVRMSHMIAGYNGGASAPALRPDGSPWQEGDLFFTN